MVRPGVRNCASPRCVASQMIWLVGFLVVVEVMGADVLTFWLIRHQPRSGVWRAIAIALLVVGVLVGSWSAFCWRYPWSENMEALGFPIPVVVFQWEDGRWVDYVGNPLLAFVSLFLVASAFLVPVLVGMVVAWLWRLWKKS